MNFAKRALAGTIRKPGRAMILLALIFILGNIIAGAVSVRQAVESTELSLRTKMSPVATIGTDAEGFSEMYRESPNFNPEQVSVEAIEKIGALPYVKYFDYSYTMYLTCPSLVSYSENEESYVPITFTGVNDPDILDRKERRIDIVSGRVFQEQEITNLTYVAIISQKFANVNNLSVGSHITAEMSVYDIRVEPEAMVATQRYDFQVIGLFEPAKRVRTGNENLDYQLRQMEEEWENKIYVSNRVLNEAATFSKDAAIEMNPEMAEDYPAPSYTTLFVLNDPDDAGSFSREAAVFLPSYYKMEISSSFNQVEAPMESMRGIADNVLYIGVGAAIVTIRLVITLFLRDRRHEIGIYLSLA
ncbi:MAG: ABC transporter permease [Peptococcaceae bacterium]|nr:ABC transporter permease [Peptococcaceae bacterium]